MEVAASGRLDFALGSAVLEAPSQLPPSRCLPQGRPVAGATAPAGGLVKRGQGHRAAQPRALCPSEGPLHSSPHRGRARLRRPGLRPLLPGEDAPAPEHGPHQLF